MQTDGTYYFCYACGSEKHPAPMLVPSTVGKAVKKTIIVRFNSFSVLHFLYWRELDILPLLTSLHTIAKRI